MDTLHTKYRPRSFNDILGNQSLIEVIKADLVSGLTPHTILLSGEAGNGKTTTARIIAKALNCHNLREDGEPCNQCDSCIDADNQSKSIGSHTTIFEMDCGTNGSADAMRELTEKAYIPPPGRKGTKKIYILDEVHLVSDAGKAALLKTLEETPQFCYFILCTNVTEKLSKAIMSRCTQYKFRSPSFQDKLKLLAKIADAEGIEIDDEGLEILVRQGSGVRDTIQNLALCRSLHDLSADRIAEHLYDVADRQIVELVTAIHEKDLFQALHILATKLGSREAEVIGIRLLDTYRQILADQVIYEGDRSYVITPLYKDLVLMFDRTELETHFRTLFKWSMITVAGKGIAARKWLECLIINLCMDLEESKGLF